MRFRVMRSQIHILTVCIVLICQLAMWRLLLNNESYCKEYRELKDTVHCDSKLCLGVEGQP